MDKLGSLFIVLLGAASYGVLATFVKIGYGQGFTVGEITGSQMFFGAVMLWMIAFSQYRKWHKLPIKTALILMAVGSLTGLTGVFYYTSLLFVPASIAIILLFQFAWIGVLLERILDRIKPTRVTYIALGLIMLGTLLAGNIIPFDPQTFSMFGVFMGLCAALTYAGFIYVSGRVAPEITPWLRSPLMITGSFIIIFIIFPPIFFTSGVLSEGLLWIALIIGFLGAVVPTVCFTFGVPKIGSGMATILSSVELPVAVFLAWIVFSEYVSILQWLGVSLIIGAIVFREWQEVNDAKKLG